MRHRVLRWFALLGMAGALLVLGVVGAAAEGVGDPHAGGDRGNPHVDVDRADPHVTVTAVVTEQPAQPTAEATTGGSTAAPALEATAASPTASAAAAPTDPSGDGWFAAASPNKTGPPNAPDPPQTGKPENGSVGNADGKSPKGQSPNDKNRGYECDSNKGIGRGNPAHSGCPEAPKPPVTPPGPVTPEVFGTLTVQPTLTTTGSGPPAAEVLGVQVTRAAAAPAGLARTGNGMADDVTTAVLLILAGVALLGGSRRLAGTAGAQ